MHIRRGRNDPAPGPRWQDVVWTFSGVGCGALLLGLVGSGAGAMWSLALGRRAASGALWGGLILFLPGLVLVPINARLGKRSPFGVTAIVLLFLAMVMGAIVWGIRVALR